MKCNQLLRFCMLAITAATVLAALCLHACSPSQDTPETITFGACEQDGDLANGKEPIQWRILAQQDGHTLLISECSLYTRTFNSDVKMGNDWETSELKAWLINDFQHEIFSASEEAQLESDLFLLSVEEAQTYFTSDEDRICQPTPYAIELDAYTAGGGGCIWWLRTPGAQWYTVARVLSDGSIWDYGDEVIGNCGGIRPAVWVTLAN